jgi:hypothetical protein
LYERMEGSNVEKYWEDSLGQLQRCSNEKC